MILQESTFDVLNKEIIKGLRGENNSIPIGLDKLGRYANIRPRILTLIFSGSGVGKSSFIDTIILNSCEAYMNSPSSIGLKPSFHLFSMERSKILRVAKWISFIVFKNEGIEIPVPKLLGWWKEKLTNSEYSLIQKQKEYIDCLLNDYINIYEGAKTPNEVYSIMKSEFKKKGEYSEEEKEGKQYKIYIKKEKNTIEIPIIDHGNLIRTTKELPTKKQAIDRTVAYVQGFRDLEESAPFWVSQVNRNIAGVSRTKDSEQELMLEDKYKIMSS